MTGGNDIESGSRNPFAPMAVARFATVGSATNLLDVTVKTDAMNQALRYVSDYLDVDPDPECPDPGGTVMSITGDYGMGKTHLAVSLVSHVQSELGDPTRAMYIDLNANSFLGLFRQFIDKVTAEGLRAQVNHYYADTVGEALQRTGLAGDTLSVDAATAPQTIVERLGLMESTLLREVQRTLLAVTQKRDFSVALTLLLRTGFDDSVWNWLVGGVPDQVLADRGITYRIDNDVAALEALGVFALLFGGKRRRFVLAIDELEKIFSVRRKPEAETMTAFQSLLDTASKAGACLILVGLPDFRDVLSPAVHARIPYPVELTGLSAEEIAEFVALVQGQSKSTRVQPFGWDTVRSIRDVTRGNARAVIRLCKLIFRMTEDKAIAASARNLAVDDETVQRAATELFGGPGPADVDRQMRQALAGGDWEYQRDHVLGEGGTTADYWITFPDRESGCAVLITRSLLTAADVDRVIRRLLSVHEADNRADVLVVVAGVLTDTASVRLREPLDRTPLRYVPGTFVEDVRAELATTRQRLPITGSPETTSALERRLTQLAADQAGLIGVVQRLTDTVESAMATSTESIPHPATTLPADVDRLFRDADEALAQLTHIDSMFDTGFRAGAQQARAVTGRVARIPDYFLATGVAVLAQRTVRSFRDALATWYQNRWRAEPSAQDHLDELCDTYDSITEFLPLFRLTPLATAGPLLGAPDVATAHARLNRVQEALEDLGPRVKTAVLRGGLR
ncbi:hypothetical protein [Actinokineospora iranica]|uniref:AAA+ ATPase domain-containing protein n=1 Tax=Actinokineospora iranica TaxID=1271860 RepID=A0A1G6WLZ7_9PSEU|nr:hypothetical protein [Actinokineospora iranica]SDD66831.1 hypothetical protein SAMN05216174_11576 [Actinokineospora iranica]